MTALANPSIAALSEEIDRRQQELDALRHALTVLQSDQAPKIQVVMSNGEAVAITHMFDARPTVNGVPIGEPPAIPTNGNGHGPVLKTGRVFTKHVLEHFDRHTPYSLEDIARRIGIQRIRVGIGALTRYGYVKKSGDGYLRTAKRFTL